MAETTSYSVATPVSMHGCEANRPLEGASVAVLDHALRPLSAGDKGKVAIGGEMLALGYLGEPELTRARFLELHAGRIHAAPLGLSGIVPDSSLGSRVFLTDLMGALSDDGTTLLCQPDEPLSQPKWRQGYSPVEVESVLRESPQVRACAVVWAPGAVHTMSCAFVVLESPADAGAEERIQAHMARYLPVEAHPGRLLLRHALPVDSLGRPDRAVLARECLEIAGCIPNREERESLAKLAEPLGQPYLEQVKSLWMRLLHRMRVGMDEDFFEAGGTPVQMIRLHAELNRCFPGAITMTELSALRTIRKILQHLTSESTRDRMMALSRRGA